MHEIVKVFLIKNRINLTCEKPVFLIGLGPMVYQIFLSPSDKNNIKILYRKKSLKLKKKFPEAEKLKK